MENDMQLVSPAFQHEGDIPVKYTCDGEELSPPLHIDGVPDGTVSLALIMEDPDAPGGTYDHWVVWDIDLLHKIPEGHTPGISGNNSAGRTGYHGPCPPDGEHRYFFYVFALDTRLDLPAGSGKKALRHAMEGHVLGKGTLMGRYARKK